MPSKYGFSTPEDKRNEERIAEQRKRVEDEAKRKRLIPIANKIEEKIKDIGLDYFANETYRGSVSRLYKEVAFNKLNNLTWSFSAETTTGVSGGGAIGLRMRENQPVLAVAFRESELQKVLSRETGLPVFETNNRGLGLVTGLPVLDSGDSDFEWSDVVDYWPSIRD